MSETMTPSLDVTPGTHVFPWWLVLIMGFITLILGIFLLYYPYGTLLVLVTFLGAYWFISGLIGLCSLFVDRTNAGWKILFGILGIIAGIAILTYPLYIPSSSPTSSSSSLVCGALLWDSWVFSQPLKGAGGVQVLSGSS